MVVSGPLVKLTDPLRGDFPRWLRTPKEMAAKAKATGKPAMPAFPPDKRSDADLEALTAYPLSLKK